MAYAKHEETFVEGKTIMKVVYERMGLLGILTWYKKVYQEKVGQDLFIETREKFENIYLNGNKIQ